MKITRLLVGKGVSREVAENRWEKSYFEVEALLESEGEASAAKDTITRMIEGWLPGTSKQTGSPEPAATAHSFDSLPWKTYQSKRACEKNEAGWTFKCVYGTNRMVPGAEGLVAQLDPEGKTWTRIGAMEYRLSGEGLALIQRRP